MRITHYTDYSLRVLIYLGLKRGELATIREIAEYHAISRNHLMKVVQDLNGRGYLAAVRGKYGGLRLNRQPEMINIGQLVRETEPDLAIVECFTAQPSCVIAPECRLKGVFHEALDAFLQVLDRYTLADLLQPEHRAGLMQLLDMTETVVIRPEKIGGE